MRGTGGGGFTETKENACHECHLNPALFDRVDGTKSRQVAEAALDAAESSKTGKAR